MMIRLKHNVKTSASYTPPVPVTRHFDDVDTDASLADQLETMLWIPAVLVSRYLGQFPFLENEADEMFSVGVLRVAELIDEAKFSGDQIVYAAIPRVNYAIESYVNNLDSIVKVSTSTRYNNLRKGKMTPQHQALTGRVANGNIQQWDDHSELLVRDACEVLGFDPDNLNMRQKRRLAEVLLDIPE